MTNKNVISLLTQCFLLVLSGACNDGDIRLVGGTLTEEGRLEVCMNEVWGTVCGDTFTSTEANVACRQLGYSRYSELNKPEMLLNAA